MRIGGGGVAREALPARGSDEARMEATADFTRKITKSAFDTTLASSTLIMTT